MKVFVVVLILILVLFAVGAGMGFSQGNHKKSSGSKDAENYEPGGFESGLDGLVAPLRPAADLKEKKILPGQTVRIPASKSPVRTVKLRAKAGCQLSARYQAEAPPKADVNPIPLKFPRDGKGDRMVNSIPLLKEAGTISDVKCSVQHSCPGLEVVRD